MIRNIPLNTVNICANNILFIYIQLQKPIINLVIFTEYIINI